MARKIKEEELRLNIVVNGDPVRKEIAELMAKNRQLKATNDDLERSQKKLAAAGKKDTEEYRALTHQIEANKAAMAGNRGQIDKLTAKLKVNDMTIAELNRRIRDLKWQWSRFDPNSKKWEQCNAELTQLETRLAELKGKAGGVQSAWGKMTSGYSAMIGKLMVGYAAVRGFFNLFASGFRKIKEFEQANVNLSTILGVHVSKMTALTKSALELGRTTEYTASQVTGLQTELAKLGFGQTQILQMTKPVLQFATAVGAELPEAAALAGATLRAFDKDATDADDVLATMAVATNKSALSFAYLQTSMSIVAPVAKTFGFDVKDTIALLGTLANSGFDASSAATATRNILLNLADANGKLAKELGKPVKTLPDLIAGLRKLDEKGVNLAKTLELTDKRSVAAFNTFLRGAGAMGELRGNLEDVDGELERISEERLQTVEGSIKILESTWEGLLLSFYNSKGFIKFAIDGLTGLLTGITNLIKGSEPLIDQFDQQLDRVASLEREIPPLASEYDMLRSKTSLNADEQERLKAVTKQLAAAYPGAITAVDEYGNAIEINTGKIRQYLDAEKARLKYIHADAIKDLEKEVKKQQQIIENARAQIERGVTYTGGSLGGDIGYLRDLTSEEIKALQRNIAHAREIREGALAQLKRLNGEELDEMIQSQQERRDAEAAAAEEERKQRDAEDRARKEKQRQQEAAAAAYKALDEKEITERLALKKDYLAGVIATEEEYNARLLQLNIDALKKRIQSGQVKGKERLTMEEQLTTLLLQQKKQEQKKLEEIEKQRIENITDPIEKEEALYAQQQKKYAGNTAMLEQLARNHARKSNEIKLKQALEALKIDETNYKEERGLLVRRQAEELSLSTLTNAQRKRLKKKHIEELKALDAGYYTEVLQKIQQLFSEGQIEIPTAEGMLKQIDLDTELLSEEEKKQLQEMIDAFAAKLQAAKEAVNELGLSFTNKQGNIFGFSQDDWNRFFRNLADGKFGVDELSMTFGAVSEAANMALNLYSGYDKMMTAKENAELKKYKKNQNAKKKQLQSRLDAGLMSQAQYDAETQRMDEEYDKKQEALEIKQAKRQKAMSLAQVAIDTAAAVGKAIALYAWPWSLIPIAFATATGAAQAALIAATPIAGAEAGGFPVERAQDGKRFNASVEPDKRGYVDRPTVLVGENGMEYVIPNEAMQNPTAVPIIDTFEAVRRRGRLRDFDFSQVLPTLYAVPGRAVGGRLFPTSNASLPDNIAYDTSTTQYIGYLKEIIYLLKCLDKKADNPTPAVFSMLGRGGFVEEYNKYLKLKRNGQLGI